MTPRKTPRDWRREVLRSTAITDPVRVLLLVLAEHMKGDLTVSVPRRDLARWLNRSEKRITDRIASAHAAGLLDTVSPGFKGHTAVYAALFPEAKGPARQDPLDTAKGPVCKDPKASVRRDPLGPQSETPGGLAIRNTGQCRTCGTWPAPDGSCGCTPPPPEVVEETA